MTISTSATVKECASKTSASAIQVSRAKPATNPLDARKAAPGTGRANTASATATWDSQEMLVRKKHNVTITVTKMGFATRELVVVCPGGKGKRARKSDRSLLVPITAADRQRANAEEASASATQVTPEMTAPR